MKQLGKRVVSALLFVSFLALAAFLAYSVPKDRISAHVISITNENGSVTVVLVLDSEGPRPVILTNAGAFVLFRHKDRDGAFWLQNSRILWNSIPLVDENHTKYGEPLPVRIGEHDYRLLVIKGDINLPVIPSVDGMGWIGLEFRVVTNRIPWILPQTVRATRYVVEEFRLKDGPDRDLSHEFLGRLDLMSQDEVVSGGGGLFNRRDRCGTIRGCPDIAAAQHGLAADGP